MSDKKMPTKEQMVDLAGKISTRIKSDEKDLDQLKTVLRNIAKKAKLPSIVGEQYELSASPWVSVEVLMEPVIRSYFGFELSLIKPDDQVSIKGQTLIDFLKDAAVPVKALRSRFTEDSVKTLIETKEVKFHTLTITKKKPVTVAEQAVADMMKEQ